MSEGKEKPRKTMRQFGQLKPGACRSCWQKERRERREQRAKRQAARAGIEYVPEQPKRGPAPDDPKIVVIGGPVE